MAIVAIGGVALLLLISLIAVRRVNEFDRRLACETNFKGLGLGMYTYANENANSWPIATHAPATEEGACAATYAPGKIGTRRGNAKDPKAGETTIADTELSVTRNLWTLMRLNLCSPKSFVCPSSQDQPNQDEDPRNYWDFAKYSEVSYGLQVPYGKTGRPSTTCDARMILAADKGPFGAALEAGARDPGPPTLGTSAKPEDWRPWNSPNHGGEGQIVLYADAHVQFEQTPLAGYLNDNIYTRWSDPTGGFGGDENIRVRGTPPTGNEAPFSDTDSLIYP